jgi:N-acetylglucosamine kinase-like BadF-type ATPase
MKIVLKPVHGRIAGADLMETHNDTVDSDMDNMVHFMQKHYGMRITKAAPNVFDVCRLTEGGDYVQVGIICLEE